MILERLLRYRMKETASRRRDPLPSHRVPELNRIHEGRKTLQIREADEVKRTRRGHCAGA